jgi:hypothetical protein
METGIAPIEFTLRPDGVVAPVHVRMRKRLDRWAVEVSGVRSGVGIGVSAREALAAALEPLGEVQARRLLADLGLIEPSIAVVSVQRAASGYDPL